MEKMKEILVRGLSCLPFGREGGVWIAGGRVGAGRGKFPPAVLSAWADTASAAGVNYGCIWVGARLRFLGVPRAYRQRFRNAWSANVR